MNERALRRSRAAVERSTSSTVSIPDVRTALQDAVRFLLASQLPSGEIPTHVSRDRSMERWQRDSTPFATTFGIEALRLIGATPRG